VVQTTKKSTFLTHAFGTWFGKLWGCFGILGWLWVWGGLALGWLWDRFGLALGLAWVGLGLLWVGFGLLWVGLAFALAWLGVCKYRAACKT
jgi:hypothetical protein